MPEKSPDEASPDDVVSGPTWKRKTFRAVLFTVGGSGGTALFMGGWPVSSRMRPRGPLLSYLPHGFGVFALYTLGGLILALVAGLVLYVLSVFAFAARCFWKASQQIEDPEAYDRWTDLAIRALHASFRGLMEGFHTLPGQFRNRAAVDEAASRSRPMATSRSASKVKGKKKPTAGRHRKESGKGCGGDRPNAENAEHVPDRATSRRAEAAWKAVREEQLRTALSLALRAHLSAMDEYEVNRDIVDNVLRDIAGESDGDVPKPTSPGDDASSTRASDD
jgi:hypothetical protein